MFSVREGLSVGIPNSIWKAWPKILVPRPLSQKAEEGLVFWATFLVTWGVAYSVKNVIFTFYIRDLVFWQLRLLHSTVYKDLIRPQSFLGKLRTSCKVSFFYFQFGSKYDRLRHTHIIICSRIWFELSDWELPRPMWQEKSVRTPDPLSHTCREGLGTRLDQRWAQSELASFSVQELHVTKRLERWRIKSRNQEL